MSVKQDIHDGNWLLSVFKHGKWYLISSLFSKGINILMLRLYTEYLTPAEYGILDSLNSVALLLPIFISLYLDSAFGRFFHEFKNDFAKLKKLFSTIYLFVIGFGVIIVLSTLLTSKFWISDLLEVPVYPYALLAFIPPLFFQVGNLGLVFLRQSLLSRQTTIVEVSSVLINILIAVPLLVWVDLGVIAKLWGRFAMGVFLFIYYTFYLSKIGLLSYTFSKSILKQSLYYSVPLIPNIAGGWIAGLSDRLVIAKYSTLEAVGLYSIGFTLGKLLYLVQDAITQVVTPVSMSGLIYDKENTKRRMAETSLLLWGGMLFVNFTMFIFSKEIISIFADESYSDAYMVIPIIGFTYVLGSQYRVFSTIISFHKKNWVISSGGIIQAIINLGLNLFLVPIYGYIVAAFTTVVSTMFYLIWLYIWSLKWDKLYLDFGKIILLLLVFLTVSYLIYVLDITHFLNKILLVFILFFVAIFIVDSSLPGKILRKMT